MRSHKERSKLEEIAATIISGIIFAASVSAFAFGGRTDKNGCHNGCEAGARDYY